MVMYVALSVQRRGEREAGQLQWSWNDVQEGRLTPDVARVERSPLSRKRDFSNRISDLSFEDIDLRSGSSNPGSIGMLRSRVSLVVFASASGETLAGEVGESVVEGLVSSSRLGDRRLAGEDVGLVRESCTERRKGTISKVSTVEGGRIVNQ
jgi:hypothetical protein